MDVTNLKRHDIASPAPPCHDQRAALPSFIITTRRRGASAHCDASQRDALGQWADFGQVSMEGESV